MSIQPTAITLSKSQRVCEIVTRHAKRMLAATAASAMVVLVAATTLAAPPAQARMVMHQLNIPAQDLGEALKALSAAADEQVLFSDQVVRGKRSGEIEGSFTTDQALDLLLQGSGLKAERTPSGVLLIKEPGTPAPAVTPSRKDDNDVGKRAGFWDRFRVAQTDISASEVKKDEASSTQLEEIVVTATKRAESIRDVPLSITAITAKDIEQRGLVNAEDYLRGIPGANQTELGWSGQAIVIRGLETTLGNQSEGAGSTTATYFGETPTTGSAGAIGSSVDIKLVDVERVEVLRGPQGTAFGNSSMGGAVRVIPAAPSLTGFEGKIRAGFGSTSGNGGDNYNFQAIGNAPLIADKVAIRAVAYRFSDSGFYRNRAGSDAAFLASLTNPVTGISYGAEPFARDDKEVGGLVSTGARISALFKLQDNLDFTLSYLHQKTEVDGWATATSGTYEQNILQVAPEHVRRGETAGVADTDIDLANAMLSYDLQWADFVATYSYVDSGSVLMHPYTEAPLLWVASDGRETDVRTHVGEIRLATKLDGAWNFLGGLYGEKSKSEYVTSIVWYGDAAQNLFTPGGDRLLSYLVDLRDMTQKAAFGEASWELVPNLTLTGGVRAYKYDRTVRTRDAYGFFMGGSPPPTRDETKDSGTNFRANLSYKVGDGALLYAGFSQGFRVGQPQTPVSAAVCDLDGDGIIDETSDSVESTRQVGSDSVDSYEIGGKFTFLDRRVNIDAAVFRMNWADIPIEVVAPCQFSYVKNAGSARSEGVEAQADFQVTDAFRVSLGGSWIDAKLTTDGGGFSSGDRLAGSPKGSANLGLQYGFDFAGHKGLLRADGVYVGRLYSRVGEAPGTEAGDYVKLDLLARMSMQRLDVDLYVRNVTDEDAFVMRSNYGLSSGDHGYRMRPRTIGVQLAYSF